MATYKTPQEYPVSISALIEENDVSLVTLSLALEQASIEFKTRENNRLYVTEDGYFPFWIEIAKGAHYVFLTSHLEFVEGLSEETKLEFCNQVNARLYIPSANVQVIDREGERICRMNTGYPIFYRDGLIPSQFIRLCRLFSEGMKQIVNELDAEHELLQPL